MKVDLGCGKFKREGYVGVDLVENGEDPPKNVDYVMDLRSGLPFADEEVDDIFCSHFLEHLTNAEGLGLLKDCTRVLKPGGILELIVPDFIWCLEKFLSDDESKRWGYSFNTIFGLQTHPGEYHKNGFSKDKAVAICTEAGLVVEGCVPIWTHDQRCILIKAVKSG